METHTNRILITGVAGLIGSRFAKWILENTDYKIIGIDNLSGGLRENLINLESNDRFYFYNINVESDELETIFETFKPDIVFHAQAYAAEAASPFIRKYNVINNALASANVINNCINYDVKRLVFLSSTAVYGVGNPPFMESHTPAPIDSYGVMKFATESDIKVAGNQHGLDWCIIRPRNVYGIGQNIFDPLRNLFGIWMYRHLHHKPLLIYGDGLQTRMFTFIDDTLECFWKACTESQCSKQIINLGGTKSYTIKESAEMLIDIMASGYIEYEPPRHEVKHTICDWQKSVDLLGFEHKTELKDGLTQMWNWAQTLEMRPRLIFEKYEITRGLYPYWTQEALKLEDGENK